MRRESPVPAIFFSPGDQAVRERSAAAEVSERRGRMDGGRETEPLTPGHSLRVRLVKQQHSNVEYPSVVSFDDGMHLVVVAEWPEETPRDLGFVRFEPGDVFTEHYWRDRWYSIKEVRGRSGALKGWYCDVTRPVRISGGLLVSEDLFLDLWVSADRRMVLRLDEEDFAASGLSESDPLAATAARQALDELERLARDAFAEITEPVPPVEGPQESAS